MSPSIRAFLPAWLQGWLGEIQLLAEVVLILVVAWLLLRLLRLLVQRLSRRYDLPIEIAIGVRRVGVFVIGIIVDRIQRAFDTLDTRKLTTLHE